MNAFKQLWSFNGRIGRGAYAGGLLLNLAWTSAALVGLIYLGPFNLRDGSLTVLLALWTWAYFALTAKRLHDLGVSGLFSLLLLVPGAVLIMTIILLIPRGDDNDNRYGPGATSTSTLAPAHHA
jgi:uncharacterized membrane protein YhaH (DUF805 family)